MIKCLGLPNGKHLAILETMGVYCFVGGKNKSCMYHHFGFSTSCAYFICCYLVHMYICIGYMTVLLMLDNVRKAKHISTYELTCLYF